MHPLMAGLDVEAPALRSYYLLAWASLATKDVLFFFKSAMCRLSHNTIKATTSLMNDDIVSNFDQWGGVERRRGERPHQGLASCRGGGALIIIRNSIMLLFSALPPRAAETDLERALLETHSTRRLADSVSQPSCGHAIVSLCTLISSFQ